VKNARSCPWMLAVVVVLAASSASRGEVELVKDGRAVSEIVIAPDASQAVQLAAQDLQKHLKQMSGAELPIVTAPSPGAVAGLIGQAGPQFVDGAVARRGCPGLRG